MIATKSKQGIKNPFYCKTISQETIKVDKTKTRKKETKTNTYFEGYLKPKRTPFGIGSKIHQIYLWRK